MNGAHIVLAGGSGFLGSTLSRLQISRGARVTVLSRSEKMTPGNGIRYVAWDGRSLGKWTEALEGADAVINFSGKNVNCRLTVRNRQELLSSRWEAVKILGEAVSLCHVPPKVFVHCSAVGFYGDVPGICDERSLAGAGMLAEISKACEAAFNEVEFQATRKVVLRLGMVLGSTGGALPVLVRLTRCFLGGPVGNGRQGVSWIHIQDLNRVFLEVLGNSSLAGVFNAVAPHPLSNADLMRTLRRVVGRPWCPPAPAVLFGAMGYVVGINSELILTGQRCVPTRLEQAGFTFEYKDVEHALQNLLGSN